MQATIITIGDEILIGQIVDTNAVFISHHLNQIGVVVRERLSIGDEREAMLQALGRAMRQSEVVIVTGGLGPTKDDITKKTLAELFASEMYYNEEVARHVEHLLSLRGVAFNDLNRGQAMVPRCCEVLFNDHGTAPGMWFSHEGGVVISLPGVPFEMEHLMLEQVLPRLKERFSLRAIVHRTLITAGLAESILAERIEKWEEALPPYLKLAYLPNPGRVRLRLSAYEVEGDRVEREIEARFEELRALIPDYVIGYEGASVEQLVHDELTARGKRLAIAESCTGGAIAATFTAMAGASAYLQGGVVAYQNEVKEQLLGVEHECLVMHGAVSEEVVSGMAEGVRRRLGADYGLATSGIAGPAGGSAEKPVGTVWMAVATPDKVVARRYHCGTDRGQIIRRATAHAIQLLREVLAE